MFWCFVVFGLDWIDLVCNCDWLAIVGCYEFAFGMGVVYCV